MKKYIPFLSIFILIPFLASAQTGAGSCGAITDLVSLVGHILCLLTGGIIPLLYVAATALFIYGVVNYIREMGDVKKREEAKQLMIWGIIALFVMTSVWGIVRIITVTFPNQDIPSVEIQ